MSKRPWGVERVVAMVLPSAGSIKETVALVAISVSLGSAWTRYCALHCMEQLRLGARVPGAPVRLGKRGQPVTTSNRLIQAKRNHLAIEVFLDFIMLERSSIPFHQVACT